MNNYNGSASAPAPAGLTDRVALLERGLELVMGYADNMGDHYGARFAQLEAQIHGQPTSGPFPSFREWAEQREKRSTSLDSPELMRGQAVSAVSRYGA